MTEDSISKMDFPGTRFKVVQSLIRNKYDIYNSDDELILKAKQKMFRMKEEFPFVDPEGETVFTVKAAKVLDIAGDYAIFDGEDGDKIGLLTKKFSFLKHIWHVRDPETEEKWATIESRSALLELLRSISDILSFIPHKYTINSEDKEIGRIEGKFSLKDTYSIELKEEKLPHKEAILAAAIAIDALEGN